MPQDHVITAQDEFDRLVAAGELKAHLQERADACRAKANRFVESGTAAPGKPEETHLAYRYPEAHCGRAVGPLTDALAEACRSAHVLAPSEQQS